MFQWNRKMRDILKDSTDIKEAACREMIQHGYNFLIKYKDYGKPRSWSFAKVYIEEIENYIMEKSIPGTYDSMMIKVSADHAAFIADYGWEKYEKEMQKPQEVGDAFQFFYDQSFDDYDAKPVEIEDIFKKNEDDDMEDDYDFAEEGFDEVIEGDVEEEEEEEEDDEF